MVDSVGIVAEVDFADLGTGCIAAVGRCTGSAADQAGSVVGLVGFAVD